ncbi:TonB-dependent receptor domain-containing protein [Horticoccus sp. 23ND18S-11]|uniref:TonB-dependent receptor domain-containing protein n=1 Tax=Horticoccus sp. 23ND18S-11 TaxID=3391832 RepID=UPI0039C99297
MKTKPFPRLRAALIAILALPILPAAFAQVAPAAPREEAVKLEAFTVVGSNIRRLDVEKVLPVTVFDTAAIEVRDAAQPSDLLTALPQVTGLPGNETATLGATARGDNASISLRGIPSSNTLILLNGRRLVPHPISQGEAGVPTLSTNVNQLPNRGIDRVELLRDGASSVYGTDAVAGVVNYAMARNFRGTELALRYGQTDYNDGQEYRATLTHGFDFAKGRGRAMVTADFYQREAMYARDREFSADADHSNLAPAPWNVPTVTTFNARSATTEYGNYLLGTVTATNEFGAVTGFTGARPAGVPATLAAASGLFVLQPNGSGGAAFGTATPSRAGVTRDYYWNNNAYRVIQPETARTNVFASAEFDVSRNLTVFTDASLYRANSVTYREPDGITQSTDGFIIVPATNPYNPFGTRFWSPTGAPNTDGTPRLTGTPSAVSITNKRLTDIATRTDYVDTAVYRGVAGIRGKLLDSWTWEAALLYSAARVIENEEGPSRKSQLITAINQTDPARAFNPFTRAFAVQNGALVSTGPFKNPDSVTSTFRSSFIRSGITKLGSGDFRASGDVFPLWGGNKIGGAFGGEFRYEAYDDFRPPYAGLNPPGSGLDLTANDFLGFSPNSDTHGNRHVAALYAEAVVPLVGRDTRFPLVHSLELTASGRYESYTDFGDTTKPKYGVNWKPAGWVMVRGSYNQGFHAPNLAQLFTGTLIRTVTGSTDTYRSTVTGLITDGPSNRRSVASGNRQLQPETSTGKSAGIVIEVPGVKGLSVSVDYWEIRQKNLISSGGGIADDTAALLAATQSALAAGQAIGSIDLGSGTGAYKGDPSVVRLAPTQADRDFFNAYNATRAPGNQRAVVGGIDILRTSYFNKSQQFVNGFDFDVNYRFPQFAVGQFTLNTNWTYLNDFHAYTAAGSTRTEYRNGNSANVGGATPIWRGGTTLTWRKKQWSGGFGMYYIGRFTDLNATTTQTVWDSLGNPTYIQPIFNNGAYSYRYVVHDSKSYNLFASYRLTSQNRWLSQTSIRVGVNNLFDATPPLSADSRGYEPSLYNVMARGRTYSLQITKKL